MRKLCTFILILCLSAIFWVISACSVIDSDTTEGLAFALNDDGKSYSIVGIGSVTDTDIIIPAKYNDLPVTGICAWAFEGSTDIVSITIPSSVKSIEMHAFRNCRTLTSVTIPHSVKSIGECAFFSCPSLTSITYTGTEIGWKGIDKGVNWDFGSDHYTIHYYR